MLVESFLENARCHPHKLAARDQTRALTYAQLTTLAAAVRRLVLTETQCERVGVMLPASAGGLGSLLGTLWAGRTVVPLNFLLQPRELAAVIADARIDLVITIQHFAEQMQQLPVRALYLEQAHLRRRYVWEKLRRTPEPPAVDKEDLAAIVYTSGTTGRPKGVCLSHDNLLSNCRSAIEHIRIQPDHHLLGIIPPFHAFGLTVLFLLPPVLGAAVTYIPRFSPQATYEAAAKDGVSILVGVPSMYGAVARLKSIDRSAFGRIHLAISGGEPLSRRVYDDFFDRTGVRLMEGYGLTETSPVISCDLPWDHQVGTVGRPLPGVEIQIRDSDGRLLAPEREGELCVRGPLVMKGYFNQPQETAGMIDDQGWLHTGDIVRVDDGHIRITGRAKDLIIVGGENVYPREVESVLEQHPAVAEAAVVGTPDASRGEVVVAFVCLREGTQATEEDLRTFCRKHLAGFKTPRRVHIYAELPRGPTGKVLKRELATLPSA